MHSIVAQIQEYLVIDDDLMHTIVVWAEIPILVATEGELSGGKNDSRRVSDSILVVP
jgi:hypothetical protein